MCTVKRPKDGWLRGERSIPLFKAIRSLCDMTDLEICLAGDYAEDAKKT